MSFFNSQNTSIRWLVAELTVVVLGILIALAASAWWEGVALARWEENQLLALQIEFQDNLQLLEQTGYQHNQRADSIAKIHNFSTSNEIGTTAEFPIMELTNLVAWRTSDVASGTLDALLASGELGNIRNDELRQLLALWPARVLDSTEDENLGMHYIEFELAPRLASQDFLSAAYANRIAMVSNIRDYEPVDTLGKITITPELPGLIAARLAHQRLAAISISRLEQRAAAILELIDYELARR